MTHKKKRPRKIAQLKNDIVESAMWGENTFSELIEASSLAIIEVWRRIEKEHKIPCPTCPKDKRGQ
jgi:hypothetical protein